MRVSRAVVRLLVIVASLSPVIALAQGQGAQKFKTTDKYVPGQLIVRYKDSTLAPRIGAAASSGSAAPALAGAKVARSFRKIRNLRVVQLPEGTTVQQALDQLRTDPNVLYAEPDYIMHTDEVVPNDPQFNQLWGMKNTGQAGGTVDADIDATDAWALTTGSNSVIVGTTDSGLDYNHPDLAANVFTNTADCNFNGIDDDGNGYVDDCHGWNASYNSGSMFDDVGHGTHVAGTIGATGNNDLGVVGVNWHVTIMPCKAFVPDGFGGAIGATSDEIECLNYFATMKDLGYNIVATNNSWGGGSYSRALYEAINENMDRGILFIAAAGNGDANGVGLNNDQSPHYPSTYDLANIIAVAATTRTDAKSSFSNFGRRTVDLGAPGSSILSTLPGLDGLGNPNYGVYNGTSMATPHVTGTAALLKAHDPSLTWYQIRNLILAGGDVKSSMASTFTGKRLNAFGSMTCVNRPVSGRMTPDTTSTTTGLGDTVLLSYLNINCKDPAAAVSVTVAPGGTVPLHDDGANGDLTAGDGVFTALLNTSIVGTTTVTFPGSDVVTIKALRQYAPQDTPYSYRTFTGTNLQLTDESSKAVTTPFPIKYGGGSFSTIYVGSNGVISFDKASNSPFNEQLPTGSAGALIAPWWQDFQPVPNVPHNVFTGTLGTAPNREFVVEWRDVPLWQYWGVDLTQTVKFQVVFFEGKSDVLLNYADVFFTDYFDWSNRGYYATIGLQVGPRSGEMYSYLQQKVNNGTAVLWTLQADDFSLEVANPVLTAFPGQTIDIQASVASLAAFDAPVTLSCVNGQPPSSCDPQLLTPTHDPANVAIPVSDPNVRDLTFDLQGSGGGIQRSVPITLKVVDFQLGALSTNAINVGHGTAKTIDFTLTPNGSFNQSVALSCSALPAGAACTFTPAASVPLVPGTAVPVQFSVSSAWNTPVGQYPIEIIANTAVLPAPKTSNVALTISSNTDYSITPGTAVTMNGGASTTSSVLIEAHDGYTGTVNLSCSTVPAGPSCSVVTTSASSFPATVTVNITATNSAIPFFAVVTADDGVRVHTASIPVTVRGFSVDQLPLTFVYQGNSLPIFAKAHAVAGYQGFAQMTCDVSAIPGSTGCNSNFVYFPGGSSTESTFSVYFSVPTAVNSGTYPVHIHLAGYPSGTPTFDMTFNVTVRGLTVTRVAPFTKTAFAGDTGTSFDVTVTPTNGFDLPIQFGCDGSYACTTNPSGWINLGPDPMNITVVMNTPVLNFGSEDSIFTPRAGALAGPYGMGFYADGQFTLHLKDFSVQADPYSSSVMPGTSAHININTTAFNGFEQPITFTCPSTLPVGVSCALGTQPVTPGSSTTATFSVSAAVPAQEIPMYFNGTATANGHPITHQVNAYLFVLDIVPGVTPASATVPIGGSALYQVSYNPLLFGSPSHVNLSCDPLPLGLTCSFDKNPLNYWENATLTVTAANGLAPAPSYNVTVRYGIGDLGSRTKTVTIKVTDFSVTSAAPATVVNDGSNGTISLNTKSLNGFNSSVALSCAGLPAGAACTFSNNNFVPSATGTTTTVTVTTATSTVTGVYPFTITGTGAGEARSVNATLTVKDFHFAAVPTSRSVGTVPPGQTDHTTYALSLFADHGFSSSVTLSCITPLPTGVTCAFTPSSLVPSGAGAASTLNVTVSSTTPPGTYTLNVKGVAGVLTRQIPLTLNTGGPNFTQAVAPASVAAVRGTGGSFTVTYTSLGGMSDPIAVGCSTAVIGITCSANPDTVTPGITPGNQSVVTFNTTGSTPAANTMVAITGSALGIVRSNAVTLSVKDFSLTSLTAGDLSVNAGATATRSVQVKSLNSLTGTVPLACNVTGSPAGVTCTVPASTTPTSTGANINVTIATTAAAVAGPYQVTVSGSNGGQTRLYQFTLQIRDYEVHGQDSVSIGTVPTGQTDLANNFLVFRTTSGFNSTVTLSCVAPLPTGVTCLFNPASLVPNYPGYPSVVGLKVSSTTPNGSYQITVRSAAGSLVKNTTFTLNVGGPNFIPTITPPSAGSLLGTPASYTLTFLTAGGMNTPIDVSCPPGPVLGFVCSADPPQVTPGVTPGNKSVITVTGTPGVTPLTTTIIVVRTESADLSKVRGVGVNYMPRDFALSTTTPARSVNAASSITNGVTVKAVNGFTGVVTLSCSIDGAPAGMTCTLPASVSPSATGSGLGINLVTTALTPAGTYTVHVNGSNSGQTRSMAFTVDVRDFTLNVSPSTQTIAGTGTGSTTFSLTLASLNGFASSVSVSCASPLPAGLTCAFNPTSIVPGAAGTPSTLTVNVTASNTQGDHPLTIRATSGALVRQQTVTVTHGP